MDQIKCPNCGYVGKPSLRKSPTSGLVTGCLLLVSFLFWPALVLAVPALIWLLVEPRQALCPECGWTHVSSPPAAAGVPVSSEDGQWRICPYCAEQIKPQALLCRFCGKEMPRAAKPDTNDTLYLARKGTGRE